LPPGNTGLGEETILRLSSHNPSRIYLAARTESKAEAAIERIKAKVPNAPVSFVQCDLTSFPSIKACAREFVSKETRLDLLFLNAGVMALPAGLTEQNYEIQFGTNHMGHALLTKLLLPTLLKTAALKDSDVRIITVASIGHMLAPFRGIAFKDLKTDMRSYLTSARYGQSKLANILYTKELQKRYGEKGIKAVAVHPGVVGTNLYESIGRRFWGLNRLIGLVCTTVDNGAKNQLWAATAEKSSVKGGEYYTPVGLAGQGGRATENKALGEELWEWTEKELEDWKLE